MEKKSQKAELSQSPEESSPERGVISSLRCCWEVSRDFPGGASSKEPACQCRRRKRHKFNPWVWKIPWRRKWQPIPVFLSGESHKQRVFVGYSPQCCRVRHDWSNLAQMHRRNLQTWHWTIATEFSNMEVIKNHSKCTLSWLKRKKLD